MTAAPDVLAGCRHPGRLTTARLNAPLPPPRARMPRCRRRRRRLRGDVVLRLAQFRGWGCRLRGVRRRGCQVHQVLQRRQRERRHRRLRGLRRQGSHRVRRRHAVCVAGLHERLQPGQQRHVRRMHPVLRAVRRVRAPAGGAGRDVGRRRRQQQEAARRRRGRRAGPTGGQAGREHWLRRPHSHAHCPAARRDNPDVCLKCEANYGLSSNGTCVQVGGQTGAAALASMGGHATAAAPRDVEGCPGCEAGACRLPTVCPRGAGPAAAVPLLQCPDKACATCDGDDPQACLMCRFLCGRGGERQHVGPASARRARILAATGQPASLPAGCRS